MSSSNRSRRGILAIAALGIALLAGCAGPTNAPTGYDETVQANFIGTCTGSTNPANGTLPSSTTTAPQNTSTTLASTAYCQCAYQVYVDNVPYDDNAKKSNQQFANFDGDTFSQLDTDLKTNPAQPPEGAQKTLNLVNPKLAECQKGETTSGSTPGSTVAGPAPAGTTPATTP